MTIEEIRKINALNKILEKANQPQLEKEKVMEDDCNNDIYTQVLNKIERIERQILELYAIAESNSKEPIMLHHHPDCEDEE